MNTEHHDSDAELPPVSTDEPTRCAACGAVIDTSDWYPVATDTNDGTLRLHPLCDEACHRAWRSAASAD